MKTGGNLEGALGLGDGIKKLAVEKLLIKPKTLK